MTHITSTPYLYFIITGILSGFLSGLLSIGGGFILVPALISIFAAFYTFEAGYSLHLILGTTMACMIVNSISSTLIQHKKTSIYWDYIRANWLYIALGTVAGVVLTGFLSIVLVKLTFAVFCIYSGIKTIFGKAAIPKDCTSFAKARLPTMLFGTLCGLISVGGANVVVPYLVSKGIATRMALGTAAAFQVPVAIFGTMAYVTMGVLSVSHTDIALGAVGYVFIPAFLIISAVGLCFNQIGATLAHKMPIAQLKKLFGIFTIFIGLKIMIPLVYQWLLGA